MTESGKKSSIQNSKYQIIRSLIVCSPPTSPLTRSVPINDRSNLFSCSPIGVPWLPPDLFNCANLEIPPWSTCIKRACAGGMHYLSQNCVSVAFTTCHKTMYLLQSKLVTKLCLLKSGTSALSEVSWQQHQQLQAPVSWVCFKSTVSQYDFKHFTKKF